MLILSFVWLVGHMGLSVVALTFSIPKTPPANASNQLSAAPIGVS